VRIEIKDEVMKVRMDEEFGFTMGKDLIETRGRMLEHVAQIFDETIYDALSFCKDEAFKEGSRGKRREISIIDEIPLMPKDEVVLKAFNKMNNFYSQER
jgi:hypothetical protein